MFQSCMLRVIACEFCSVPVLFVGESALAYDFKSKTHCGNAVRYGRALASVTLTAHHMYVILI